MAYEQPRVTRRSVSHGALNTSYANQSRISLESTHLLPPFRPLRSIREHQHTYLDPSASVEGMLRKTTETGNIGIFSIGRPNGLRLRASLGDLRQPMRSFSRSSGIPPVRDDRRQLPSYRDSTSEIISMYGSENQGSNSVAGTLSPAWDDCGQRSYSMTTCGSRGYFTPRNMGHQQITDFHSIGQRPRSPYPYPTRLARPGVRPSSPALTENGRVDYSRMVEINRIPQRTTHHPHKTLFPNQTTRDRMPLSMRYDVNQSTLSPSDDLNCIRLGESPGGNRPPLSNMSRSWRSGLRNRLDSQSSDQSLRTMSLTCMSGRYSSIPLRAPCLPPAPKKPLFYDYSEDFEDVVESPQICPVAPIPRRISNVFSSLISENDLRHVSDVEADDGDDADVLSYSEHAIGNENIGNRDGDGHGQSRPVSHMSQRINSTRFMPCETDEVALARIPMPGEDDDAVDSFEIAALGQTEQEDATRTIIPNIAVVVTEAPLDTTPFSGPADDYNVQSGNFGLEFESTRQEPSGLSDNCQARRDKSSNDDIIETVGSSSVAVVEKIDCENGVSHANFECGSSVGASSNRYSDYRDSRFFSVSSGLSDLASFVNYIDRHIQSPGRGDNNRDNASPVQSSRTTPGPDFGRIQDQHGKLMPLPPRKSSLRPQGMYNTQSNTSPGLLVEDEIDQFQVVSTRSGPTLTPQPISPAKLLRVKNSIPQLMKALPPLPGYSPAPESPFGPAVVPIDFEPFEISRLTDARSTLTEAILPGRRGNSEDHPKGHDPFVFDRRAHKPRLKLKHAASCAPGHSRDLRRGYLEQSDKADTGLLEQRPSTAGQSSSAPVKRRLPIKISRTAPNSSESEESGTMKRRPDLKESSAVSVLTSRQSIDLFSNPVTTKGAEVSISQPTPAKPQDFTLTAALQQNCVAKAAKAQRKIHQGNIPLARTETSLSSLDHPEVETEGHGDVGIQGFFSDNDMSTPRRGLKRRISNLRTKLTEPWSPQNPRLPLDSCRERDNNQPNLPKSDVPLTSTFKDLLSGRSRSRNHQKNPTNPKIRSRLGRFMQGAKDKLRAWGQHRRGLD